ncbi:MAG: DUF6470 family protein [Porcipelethomonas sp.]
MQLLDITYIPIEYNIKTENARLITPEIEPAQMSQKTTPLSIESHSENIKLRLDSSDMRRSMGMKSIADVTREAPAKTQKTANEVTSEYVNMGNQLAQQGMTIAQLMHQKSLSNITIETVIGTIPSERVHASWEPASTTFKVKKSEVEFDWKTAAKEMEFIPSKMSIEIEQLADVEIEYLGGFMYVPPSSDPD